MSDFPWDIGMVYKVITGANHPGLNCFEPQTAVGVLTTSFSSQDIRALESSEGHGSHSVRPNLRFTFPVLFALPGPIQYRR